MMLYLLGINHQSAPVDLRERVHFSAEEISEALPELVQAEGIILCALGGGVGAVAPYVAFTYTPLKEYPVPLIQYLQIHPAVCVQGIVIALLIGILAAAWPSWRGLRMQVVTALRSLE